FLARLSADGTTIDFATFVGGSSEEAITGLALGADGALYATGVTLSADFPITTGAFQQTHAGGGLLRTDGFVARFIPDGNTFLVDYATYLGGRMDEVPAGIAADLEGRAYVTGFTNSSDFPTRRALQSTYAGPMRDGEGDAFISRLSPEGEGLDFSSYLGSTEDDQATSLVLQPDGSLYLTGWTRSPDFPATPDAIQSTLRGTHDAFLVRLRPSGTSMALDYATFLGGSGEDAAYGLAVSSDESISISGATDGAAFPLAVPFQPVPGGGTTEAFVAHFVAGEDTLRMATYLGGNDNEAFPRAALGANGTVCVTGSTLSPDFPTLRAWQAVPSGAALSVFVSCFGDAPAPVDTENATDVPTAFALHANYPNPFNPTTVIPFSVARQSHVVLDVFDVTGRRVATLLDQDFAPGTYETHFDARRLASGLYLYRIRMGDFQAARSFVLIR
ncbi:MAG TPA: SBBP repeat-containing protein, partial [Rhodothermales bacterium]|nr:SBBP repeat-containing protein [Rhodothermales bacterium]